MINSCTLTDNMIVIITADASPLIFKSCSFGGYYSLFKSGIRITEIHVLKLCSSFSKMTRHSWGILFYLSKCSVEARSRFYFLVSIDSSADNFLFINKEDCVRSRSTYLKSYWAFSILCKCYVHKVDWEALCESGSSP